MKLSSQDIVSKQGLELLAKLFESSGEGIMIFSTTGSIEMVNPRAQEMFGYNEGELIGLKVENLVPKRVQHKHKQYRDDYVKKPEPRRMGIGRDLSGLRKDDSSFPLEISLSYIEHKNQKMVVAFITDISIRKENERKLEEQRQKLKEYTSELERKVKDRTSELEHLNLGLESQIQERKLAEDALKESLTDLKQAEREILKSLEKEKELGELKSRFVSMASHEFRTPLTTVLSSANLIAKYTESDQQKAREKHIERIRKSVQNLTSILNDFLSLEKLESGSQSVENLEINPRELIDDLIDEMGHNLKNNQEIKVEGKASTIHTDPHILRNILINLLSNAIKYSADGTFITVVLNSKDGLCIQVKDQGIGIPKEEQKRLFQRFFRAGNATNIQGTGLGLNIVQKYVQLINGEIFFESEEGKGSTFTLKLPQN
ncbi:MAG: PAS domain-containing sensor histidine kinase [Ekhidna sp.]